MGITELEEVVTLLTIAFYMVLTFGTKCFTFKNFIKLEEKTKLKKV